MSRPRKPRDHLPQAHEKTEAAFTPPSTAGIEMEYQNSLPLPTGVLEHVSLHASGHRKTGCRSLAKWMHEELANEEQGMLMANCRAASCGSSQWVPPPCASISTITATAEGRERENILCASAPQSHKQETLSAGDGCRQVQGAPWLKHICVPPAHQGLLSCCTPRLWSRGGQDSWQEGIF